MRVGPARVAALLAAILAALSLPAAAQTGPTRDEIDRAEDRVDQLETEVGRAREQLTSVEQELGRLDAQLASTSQELSAAQEVASEAEADAAEATARADRVRRELAAARDDLASQREELGSFARDVYKYGAPVADPGLAAFQGMASEEGPEELASTLHLLQGLLGRRALVVADTTRLILRTSQLRDLAAEAEAEEQAEADAAARAREAAASQHAQVLALVDQTDAAARSQQALLAGLEQQRGAAEQEVEDLEEAARAAREAAAAAVGQNPLGGGLVQVGGITVAESLAPQLEALLEAARADGIVLGGSGYRSPETTARLRRINGCPDVHQSPPSACRVPTARPGTSMHERGLAVDFTYQGQTLCFPRPPSRCSGNAAFDWLQANASRFGLYVLSTEAWHWSTNGD